MGSRTPYERKHSIGSMTKLHATDATEEGMPYVDEEHHTPRSPSQEGKRFSIGGHYVANEENFREAENDNPATMDSISSFLETMHSKNLTLKKLAKVQQRRIDELTHENMALRQASEMKDEEIRKTKAHMNKLRNAAGDADLSERGRKQNGNSRGSNVSKSPPLEASNSSKASAARSKPSRPSKKTTSSDRRKGSIILSHKVAVKRVMHIVRKINGACNKRSVGLYTFVSCIAQAALPELLGSSSETFPIVYNPRA